MTAKEIYEALNQLIEFKLRMEEAQESYKDTLNDKEIINEVLAPLRLERVEKALKNLDSLKDKLLDFHFEKDREERITNNLFD